MEARAFAACRRGRGGRSPAAGAGAYEEAGWFGGWYRSIFTRKPEHTPVNPVTGLPNDPAVAWSGRRHTPRRPRFPGRGAPPPTRPPRPRRPPPAPKHPVAVGSGPGRGGRPVRFRALRIVRLRGCAGPLLCHRSRPPAGVVPLLRALVRPARAPGRPAGPARCGRGGPCRPRVHHGQDPRRSRQPHLRPRWCCSCSTCSS